MWRIVIVLAVVVIGIIIGLSVCLRWLLSLMTGLILHRRVPYSSFRWVNKVFAALFSFILLWGFCIGVWQVRVNEIEYESANLPESFDGYRIVHISDLHAETYDRRPQALEKIVGRINSLNPDVIVFTGDMQTFDMGAVHRHAATLMELSAPDGIFSVLGNHDFFLYDRTDSLSRLAASDSLAAFEREVLGWKVLRNGNEAIYRSSESIAIAGVDNSAGEQGFKTIQMGDLNAATDGLDGIFTILLSHDPSFWDSEVLPRKAADITLSGHTHAAQIRLFGWTPASLEFRECDGRYDRDGMMLYVNAGLGGTMPFRFSCPSEITLITLSSSEKQGAHPHP